METGQTTVLTREGGLSPDSGPALRDWAKAAAGRPAEDLSRPLLLLSASINSELAAVLQHIQDAAHLAEDENLSHPGLADDEVLQSNITRVVNACTAILRQVKEVASLRPDVIQSPELGMFSVWTGRIEMLIGRIDASGDTKEVRAVSPVPTVSRTLPWAGIVDRQKQSDAAVQSEAEESSQSHQSLSLERKENAELRDLLSAATNSLRQITQLREAEISAVRAPYVDTIAELERDKIVLSAKLLDLEKATFLKENISIAASSASPYTEALSKLPDIPADHLVKLHHAHNSRRLEINRMHEEEIRELKRIHDTEKRVLKGKLDEAVSRGNVLN